MLIRPEILYSILINKSVTQNNLKKLDILNDIYTLNNILSTKYNNIKRISQFEKYKNKKSKTITELIDIINNTKTEITVKKMFIEVIKTCQINIAKNVYNILLNKWSFVTINIISATKISKALNQKKLNNVAKINYEQNPAIIGGSITIINSLKIDNSITGRLNAIEKQLIASIK